MGRFSHKSIIINRMDLPEEKQHFHPFQSIYMSLSPTAHISVLCSSCDACLCLHPVTPHRDTAVNPSFPACFATDRQLFITTSRLTSKYCPAVSNCFSTRPKYPLLYVTDTCTYVDIAEQMEVQKER